MPPSLHLIILAGGLSTRARRGDAAAPKQFRMIGGTMLFMLSVRELLRAQGVSSLTVAVPGPWEALAQRELETAELTCDWYLAPAGTTRTASTWSAARNLETTCSPSADDLVAVHDAARPFASHHLLNRLVISASEHDAAVPGVAVPDTIVRIEEREASDEPHAFARYLDRNELQAVQTPQVFRWHRFYEAHLWCHEQKRTFTDDGGLLAACGLRPVVVMGEPENWKVTTEGDWTRAESLLRSR